MSTFLIINKQVVPIISNPSQLGYLSLVELNELATQYIGKPFEQGSGISKQEACSQIYTAISKRLGEGFTSAPVAQPPAAPPVIEEVPPAVNTPPAPPVNDAPPPQDAYEPQTTQNPPVVPNTPGEIVQPEKPKPATKRASRAKTRKFAIGVFHENKDSVILTDIKESIEDLIERTGKTEFTPTEIMNDAKKEGNFDYSSSTQTPEKLFSRQVPKLKEDGFLIE